MFETVEELELRIDEYFEDCITEKNTPTVSGLSLYVGFLDRQSLFDYVNKDYTDSKGIKFSSCIKKAKSAIERNVEDQLLKGEGNQAGRIFVLKNGFNWRDKTEIDATIKGEMSMIDLLSKPKEDKEDNKD